MRLAFLILSIVVLSACGDDEAAERDAEQQAMRICVAAGNVWANGVCSPPPPEPEPTRTDRLRDAATERGVSEILNRFAPPGGDQ